MQEHVGLYVGFHLVWMTLPVSVGPSGKILIIYIRILVLMYKAYVDEAPASIASLFT